VRGTGKLVLWLRRAKGGPAEPYRLDQRGRPLWKFVFRFRGASRVIPARTWHEANNESFKLLARWDETLAAKAERKADREREVTARTVGEACDAFLAARADRDSPTRAGTTEGYRRELAAFVRPFFERVPLADVTPATVTAWKRKYASEGKARTRQRRVVIVSMVFNYAVRQGWLAATPIRDEHRVTVLKQGMTRGKLQGDQRVAQTLGADELAKVAHRLAEGDDPAMPLLVHLSGWCGFRVSEATHLRVEDVDLRRDGTAFVAVANNFPCPCGACGRNGGRRLTKSGKPRLAPVPPELVAPLRAYLTERTARFGAKGWLFPQWRRIPRGRTPAGALRERGTVLAAFKRAAGRPGLVFHDLRATADTLLTHRSGGNLPAVKVTLGHELPGMSAVYNQYAQQPGLLYAALFGTRPALALEAASA
jgi:integrase